jgi:hypothetical protein
MCGHVATINQVGKVLFWLAQLPNFPVLECGKILLLAANILTDREVPLRNGKGKRIR